MSQIRHVQRRHRTLLAAILLPLLLSAAARVYAADVAAPAAPAKERAVTLETVAGSPVKRVVLSAKAATRIDVKTAAVSEEAIVPTQMLGGIVIDPSAAGGTAAKTSETTRSTPELWIRVTLSPPEWNRLAKDKPVRIFPLETRAKLAPDLVAQPSGQAPLDNAKSGMLTLAYVVPAGNSGLVLGDRVRVEVPLEGTADKRKVVPYSAVYYDAKGDAWVYVSTTPLAFMRERVDVERVVGDRALLTSGPAVGTAVASVGVSLLYGAEIFGK